MEQLADSFQLEVNYGYIHHNPNGTFYSKKEYFLLDIVSLETLGKFLQDLEQSDINSVRSIVYLNNG